MSTTTAFADLKLQHPRRRAAVSMMLAALFVIALPVSRSVGQTVESVRMLPMAPVPTPRLVLPWSLTDSATPGARPHDLDPTGPDDVLPTVAELYRRFATILEAQSRDDGVVVEARLGALADDLQSMLDRAEFVSDERFAQLYNTVFTEYERYFGSEDEMAAASAEIFAVRAQTFAALNELENPLEGGSDELPVPVNVVATDVPMTINRAVTTAMQVLLEKRPETLANWASRAHTWFPLIERVFAEEGVPDELKYLAMIESGLRPSVRSRARAVGMWQFIAATGRAYGLVVDGWVDERMDPEQATRASAKHLKDLYARWGDWHVAMSGYNCSPRCLNRAKRAARARGVENPNFWDMYPFLPRETRNYIPQFIATSIMLSNPEAYGIVAEAPGEPFAYELVPVRGSLALRDVAEMAGTTTAKLRELNPALRRGYLPPSANPYPLRLPTGTSSAFLEAYAALPVEALRPPGEHVVRSGDTLSQIASTYGISVGRLRSDNGLRGSLIRPGQRLVVPTSDYRLPIAGDVAEAVPVSVSYGTMNVRPIHSAEAIPLDRSSPAVSLSTTTPVTGTSQSRTSARTQPAPPPTPSGTRITYTVKSGDTLSQIAEAHGVGLSRVRAWNNIRGSRIRAGNRLVLYVDDAVANRVVSPEQSSATSGVASSGPSGGATYTVRRGDTLIGIARSHRVSVGELRQWNGLTSDRIYPGAQLRVSGTD